MNIHFVCLLAALICFVLKAFNVQLVIGSMTIDFMNLGFAFVVAAFLFG